MALNVGVSFNRSENRARDKVFHFTNIVFFQGLLHLEIYHVVNFGLCFVSCENNIVNIT